VAHEGRRALGRRQAGDLRQRVELLRYRLVRGQHLRQAQAIDQYPIGVGHDVAQDRSARCLADEIGQEALPIPLPVIEEVVAGEEEHRERIRRQGEGHVAHPVVIAARPRGGDAEVDHLRLRLARLDEAPLDLARHGEARELEFEIAVADEDRAVAAAGRLGDTAFLVAHAP
jgi:hypothetical protein